MGTADRENARGSDSESEESRDRDRSRSRSRDSSERGSQARVGNWDGKKSRDYASSGAEYDAEQSSASSEEGVERGRVAEGSKGVWIRGSWFGAEWVRRVPWAELEKMALEAEQDRSDEEPGSHRAMATRTGTYAKALQAGTAKEQKQPTVAHLFAKQEAKNVETLRGGGSVSSSRGSASTPPLRRAVKLLKASIGSKTRALATESTSMTGSGDSLETDGKRKEPQQHGSAAEANAVTADEEASGEWTMVQRKKQRREERSKDTATEADEAEVQRRQRAMERERGRQDAALELRLYQPAALTASPSERERYFGKGRRVTTQLRRESQTYLVKSPPSAPPLKAELRRQAEKDAERERKRARRAGRSTGEEKIGLQEKVRESGGERAPGRSPAQARSSLLQMEEDTQIDRGMAARSTVRKKVWSCIADGGATCHMHMEREESVLESVEKLRDTRPCSGIDMTAPPITLHAKGERVFNDNYCEKAVHVSKTLSTNISAVSMVTDEGYLVLYDDRSCRYLKLKSDAARSEVDSFLAEKFATVMAFPRRNNLYEYRSTDGAAGEYGGGARSETTLGELRKVRFLHDALDHPPYRQLKAEMNARPHDGCMIASGAWTGPWKRWSVIFLAVVARTASFGKSRGRFAVRARPRLGRWSMCSWMRVE